MYLPHHLLQTPLPTPPPPLPLWCLTCCYSQTVFQKLTKTKQNFSPLRGSKEDQEEEEKRGINL
jgi:hypothetical protein